MTLEKIIQRLKQLGNEAERQGLARFGINTDRAFGVRVPDLRHLAREIGRDHRLAAALWRSGYHEARLLAAFIEEPARVTAAQLERWVKDFDSWDVCDLTCSDLIDRTAWAYEKAFEWAEREEEFVKRAGFVLMAALAVHDKGASDATMKKFLPIIKRHAADDRNFVKKAVNWALRNLGKRNAALGAAAVRTAREIERLDSRAAHWIAKDALREFKKKGIR